MSLDQGTEVTFEPVLFEPFEETVETIIPDGENEASASLSHSELISYPTIKVTFDGTEYICNWVPQGPGIKYGADQDFTKYPFALISINNDNGDNLFITETAGTHTIKVEPYVNPELSYILENGKSVNAALMRLVVAYGGTPALSDSNANLIDKIAVLVGQAQE